MLWAVVLLVGWYLGAWHSLVGITLLMLVAFAADECFRVLLLRLNRNRVGALVREHAGEIRAAAEPGAAPNGGPAMPSGDSGVSEGPPSVS